MIGRRHRSRGIVGFLPLALLLHGAVSAVAPRWGSAQTPVGSGFAYQGRLRSEGLLASGPADFRFSLWTAESGGSQVGPTISRLAVEVDKGLFHTTLDFGESPFAGDARWLAIEVRFPAGAGAYVALTPRQALDPVPYARFALGGGEWTRVGGTIHYVEGDVGIGTAAPGARLDVVGGSIRTTGQLISTAASGTPPLVVSSPSVVANLNAQLLQGFVPGQFFNASNLDSGTLPNGRLGGTYSNAISLTNVSNSFTGGGAALTGLNASNLASGTVPSGRIAGTYSNAVTFPSASNAFSGSGGGLTGLNASNISSGTLAPARLPAGGNWSLGGGTLHLDTAGGGRVGIGVANPGDYFPPPQLSVLGQLHVVGEPAECRFFGARQFGVRSLASKLEVFDGDAGVVRITLLANGNVGINDANPSSRLRVGGNITASGNCCESSDRRFKRNIVPIDDALELIGSLEAVRYEWRLEEFPDRGFEAGTQLGFIAQDVRPRLPEVVLEEADGYLAMDYGRLTTVLAAALNELREIVEQRGETIERQRAEIAAQASKIDGLQERIQGLERAVEQISAALGGTIRDGS